MKKALFFIILVVVAVAVYVALRPKSVTIVLAGQNSSGESGTAVLREVSGNVEVSLTMTGQPAGVVQPAHIHSGSCPNPGAVVYPLTFPKDGAVSVTMLDVSLSDLQAQGPLAVNVHKSAAEASVYVACGDISF